MAVAHFCLVRSFAPIVHKKRLRNASIALLVLLAISGIAFAASDAIRFVVCSITGAVVYGVPTERDRTQAIMIRDEVVRVHHFAQASRSQAGQPPVFCTAGSRMLFSLPAIISVYDVRDRVEQDRIAGAVSQFIAAKNTKPCKICFYDHENWIVDGTSGTRGSETQLRCVHVGANLVRDVSGQKVINYHNP